MKKILKIAAIVLVSLFLALLIAPFLFKDKIKTLAQKEIDKSLNAKISFSGVHLSFIRNFPNVSVGLDDLLIIGKGEFVKDTLAQVGRARAVVDIKSFWEGKEYIIKKIIFDQPTIHAIVNEKGHSNWDIVKSDSTQNTTKKDTVKTAYKLALKEYQINEGNIYYNDATLPMTAIIRNLNHSGKGNFTESIFDLMTDTRADTVLVEYAGVRYLNRNKLKALLGLNMNTKTSIYRFLDNEITINELPLKFSGMIAQPDSNDIYLDLKFDCPKTDFKQLLSLIPGVYTKDFGDIKTDGKLAFSGFTKGLYNGELGLLPGFDVKLNVENGKLQYPKLPTPVSGIQIDMNIANVAGNTLETMKLDIRKFQANLGTNPVSIKGKVQGINHLIMDADVKAKLNLGELTQIFPIEGTTLKGNFDVDAVLNGVYDAAQKAFPKVNAKMNMTNAYVKNKDYPVELENLTFNGTLQNTDGQLASSHLDIPKFHFDLDKKPFDGRVKVDNFETPSYDALVKGSVDLDKMTKIYPIEGMKLAGLFSVDGTANGVYDAKSNALPKMDMKMGMANGYVKNEQYKVELKEVNFNGTVVNPAGTMAAAILDVPKLHLSFDNEPIDGKVYVKDFDNPAFDVALNGKLDLEKVMKIYPIEGMKLAGKLDIQQFATKGTLADVKNEKYLNIPTSGKVQIANLHYESKDLAYPVNIAQGNVAFSSDKLALSGVNGTVGKTDFAIDGNLTNYLAYALVENEALGGNLNLSTKKLNVNEWMGAEEPTTTSNKEVVESQEMAVVPVPANLNVTVNTKADEVLYDNLTLKNFNGSLVVGNHALTLKNIVFQTLGGNFAANGIYSTQNEKRPLYGIDLDINNLPFKEAYKYFSTFRKFGPLAQFIEGKLNTKLKLTGELSEKMTPILQNVNAFGLFEMLTGKITGNPLMDKLANVTKIADFKEMSLQNVGSQFEIKDGFLIVAPFDMKLNDMAMNVSGRQSLEGIMDFLVKLDAPFGKGGQAAQAALSSLTGGLIKNTGRLTLDLRIGGTMLKPQITGIGKGTTNDLKNQAIDLGKDKAEDLIKQQTGLNIALNKDSLKQKVEDIKQNVVNEVKDKANEIKDQAVQQAQQQAEEIKKKLEEEKKKKEEEIRQKAEEAKKRAQDSIKKALENLKNGLPFPKWK